MSSCAIETCDRSAQRGGPGCHMCDVIAMLPQPQIRDSVRGKATRDGATKLSGEKVRGNLAFQKRKREGPHR